jgi:hypothetical protein
MTLARRGAPPARSTSGVYTSFERTLAADGYRYAPFAGYSNNAEMSGNDVIVHGGTATLNFAMFAVSAVRFTQNDTLSQVELRFTWPGTEPSTPEGLYIGLPDQATDRWVWFDARDVTGSWKDVSTLSLRGLDPGSFFASYIAVVNFSSSDVTVNRLQLRFQRDGALDVDEWLYYTSHAASDPAGFTSVSTVHRTGGAPLFVKQTDGLTTSYSEPVVVDYHGGWMLTYVQQSPPAPSEVWISDVDGASPTLIGAATDNLYTAGWDYGTDRGLFIRESSGNRNLYAFHDVIESGRLSRTMDNWIGKTVWDMSIDTASVGYGAIGSIVYDSVNGYTDICRTSGSPPFPVDATPGALMTPLPGESATDPDMVEIDELSGNPNYYVYFASRNRDDPTYNIYRLQYAFGPVEPVVVESIQEERYPTPSEDGRYLAFLRLPLGAVEGDAGELVVVDLLHPESGEQVLASDCTGGITWYDPTP